jgi:hypothetical protein
MSSDCGASPAKTLDEPEGKIDGETQFSTTWAAGVKIFPSKNFGIRPFLLAGAGRPKPLTRWLARRTI